MPKDLLKDPRERDIVGEMAETGGDIQSLWSQAKPTLERGVETAYSFARMPLTASENIAERFRPRKLPQEMTEEERQQRLQAGPPTLGQSVGALAKAATDVVDIVPGTGQELALGKLLGYKALPFMIGAAKGVGTAIDLGEAGAVTAATKQFAQGRPVMEKLLNWADPKYEGRLWTRPTGGFPPHGAFAEYLIFKGQAPGTGMKVGGLGGELRFLKAMHTDPEVGRRIYNADPVLMKYMPKFHTMPKQGSQMLMTTQMKPMSWAAIKQLPLSQQREMFIKFSAHVKILGKRMEKHGIALDDMHMSNWGIKADGTPQIMDMGMVDKALRPQNSVEAADKLMKDALWRFDWKATPGVGNFDVAVGMADKLKRGKITQVQLGKAGFWDDAAEELGVLTAETPAKIVHPPLSAQAPNDPDDIVKAMGKADIPDADLVGPQAKPAPGMTNDLERFIQADDAGLVPPPSGQQVIPDPGTPPDSLMRRMEEAGENIAELESPSAGTRTARESLATLKTRLGMYKSLDRRRAGRSQSDVWKSTVARIEKEIAKREGQELEILGPAGTSTRRRYGVETVEKKFTSDPSPSQVSYDTAKALHEKHREGGNKGAAAFWKKRADEIKNKFPSGSPPPASVEPLDASKIAEWSTDKLKGRIAAVERLIKDPQVKVAMGSRLKLLETELSRRVKKKVSGSIPNMSIRTLKERIDIVKERMRDQPDEKWWPDREKMLQKELTKRRRAQQRPRDITKEMSK
jgi:hypothetical protein